MKIEDLYFDKGFKAYATRLTKNATDAQELISNCIEACLLKKEKIDEISSRGKLPQYFRVMIRQQFYTSLTKKKTFVELEENTLIDENIEDDSIEESLRVKRALESMHFYTRGLLELYQDNSYRKIASKTGIPYVSVSNGVNAAKKEFMKIYKGMKIVVATQYIGAVEYHRLITPLVNLANKYNAELFFLDMNHEDNKLDSWIDSVPNDITHVVFSRNISTKMKPELAIAKLKKKGVRVICDIDDYWVLNERHVLFNRYKAGNVSACIQANIQMADVVWTTTNKLASEIQKVNKNVHIVKNAIDKTETQFSLKGRKKARDKFLWSGGTTHKHDLKILRPAVQDVNFSIQGAYKEQEYLTKWFPKANLIPASPVSDYAKEYLNHGIVLIPLLENKFNSMKSELKLIEAGHFGRAVICSDAYPYKPHLKHFSNCLKTDNQGWLKQINRIKGDKNLQDELGQALQEYVNKNFVLEKENRLRFDTL